MNTIFITNNKNLIDSYENTSVIFNSILLAKEYFEDYQYIIIDEDNFQLEDDSFDIISQYKDKVIILGYSMYDDFITVNKTDLFIENIDVYFENRVEVDADNLEVILDEEFDTLLQGYVNDEVSVKEMSKMLQRVDYSVRKRFYNYIPDLGNKKMSKIFFLNSIKREYIIYSITTKLKRYINIKKTSLLIK